MRLMTPKPDDYVVIDRSGVDQNSHPVSAFAVVAPKLGSVGKQFKTRAEAEAEGRRLAREDKVALWSLNANTEKKTLIESFRDTEL